MTQYLTQIYTLVPELKSLSNYHFFFQHFFATFHFVDLDYIIVIFWEVDILQNYSAVNYNSKCIRFNIGIMIHICISNQVMNVNSEVFTPKVKK